MMSVLVGFDDDTCDDERGAAQFKEVVGSTHLFNRQDIAENLAEELLDIINRLHILVVGSLDDGFRKLFLVHLLVLIQRNAVNLHRSSRNHIRWLLLADESVQILDIHLLIADDVGSNELAAVLVVESLYGGILDAWVLADNGLYFFQLDAEAANLHLSVLTSHKLDVSIWQIAYDIASTVAAGILRGERVRGGRNKGVGNEYLGCFLRTVQIASGHLRTSDPQLTAGSYRQTITFSIYDVQFAVSHSIANRNVLQTFLDKVRSYITDGFGGTIAVRQNISLWRSDRCQFLTTGHKILKRMILDAGSKLVSHLCGHKRMGNMVLLEIVVQHNQLETQILGDDVQFGTYRQSSIYLHR